MVIFTVQNCNSLYVSLCCYIWLYVELTAICMHPKSASGDSPPFLHFMNNNNYNVITILYNWYNNYNTFRWGHGFVTVLMILDIILHNDCFAFQGERRSAALCEERRAEGKYNFPTLQLYNYKTKKENWFSIPTFVCLFFCSGMNLFITVNL